MSLSSLKSSASLVRFVLHTTRYSLSSVAQQMDMQFPQPSIVPPAPSPAPIINHSPSTDPTPTAQPSAVAQPPTITQPTASTSRPRCRRLRSTGHVLDPRGLLATVMHVNDFEKTTYTSCKDRRRHVALSLHLGSQRL
eukprot:421879-Pleurochrysis_carterae.AAC.1